MEFIHHKRVVIDEYQFRYTVTYFKDKESEGRDYNVQSRHIVSELEMEMDVLKMLNNGKEKTN